MVTEESKDSFEANNVFQNSHRSGSGSSSRRHQGLKSFVSNDEADLLDDTPFGNSGLERATTQNKADIYEDECNDDDIDEQGGDQTCLGDRSLQGVQNKNQATFGQSNKWTDWLGLAAHSLCALCKTSEHPFREVAAHNSWPSRGANRNRITNKHNL